MKESVVIDESPLPLLVEPAAPAEAGLEALCEWARSEAAWIKARLDRHGGLLLRGYGLAAAEDFERLCRSLDQELLNYVGGDSPRRAVTGKIYTSTEYPSHLEIPLHNEMSYARNWPRRIYFFCLKPAQEGGETHIADGRRVLNEVDPEIRERFEHRGVKYVQNLHDGWGLGKSWQQTFETEDRSAVEAYCRKAGMEFRWLTKGLYTGSICPAVIAHPETGERVWFNQADQWHVSSRGRRGQEAMLKLMREEELPRHAYFGDGSAIAFEELEAVRAAYRRCELSFPWRRGDVLVLDNVLSMHGRKPFKGSRTTLVAMS